MNQVSQGALVGTEAVSGVETPSACPAERAAALLIEREAVQEGRLALDAEVIGGERRGRSQAGGADRNARIPLKGALAEAAFIGEEDRKKSVGNLP